MFDQNYGMFVLHETTRQYWFRSSRIPLDMEFQLLGILLGLAIYNNHILELSFPMLVYRKLMGHKYAGTFCWMDGVFVIIVHVHASYWTRVQWVECTCKCIGMYWIGMCDSITPWCVHPLLRPCLTYRPTFEDLKEVAPEIHSSLGKLLEYEDASQLGLYFQVDTEGEFGEERRQVHWGACTVM